MESGFGYPQSRGSHALEGRERGEPGDRILGSVLDHIPYTQTAVFLQGSSSFPGEGKRLSQSWTDYKWMAVSARILHWEAESSVACGLEKQWCSPPQIRDFSVSSVVFHLLIGFHFTLDPSHPPRGLCDLPTLWQSPKSSGIFRHSHRWWFCWKKSLLLHF